MGLGFWVVLLLGMTACGKVLDRPIDAAIDGAPPDTPVPVVECKAQRVVHLVGGNGGLAWFTLLWPVPDVITNFNPAFAHDSPGYVKNITSDPAHPLFARLIGARVLWEGLGKDPQPSVFMAGQNETHTDQPQTQMINGNVGLAAAGAALQATLQPKVAVLQFSPSGPYGTAPGAPAPVSVTGVDNAIAVFRGMVPPEVEQELRPSDAQLASYIPQGAVQVEVNLGTQLAFTANAFRLGLVSSVILQALGDDPHGAFTGGIATQRATNLAAMLDAFYRDLGTSTEKTCGQGGNALSLADNVMVIVTGDTPKHPLAANGWPDGTPGGSNWMYVRSNGFTRPGWFGEIDANGNVSHFNPTTGALEMGAATSSTAAAFAGALYAIARGDKTAARLFTNAPFDGVILR